MWVIEAPGLLAGAVALGVVHGVEPGHGWPVAASYALDRSNAWLYGFAAGLVIGVGHLVSSIAMVLVFFYAKSYFELTQLDDPLAVAGVEIGGPMGVVAGLLLIGLGVREYRHGHSHGHGAGDGGEHAHGDTGEHGHAHGDHDGHDHADDGHAHDHQHDHAHGREGGSGLVAKLKSAFPVAGGHDHDHGNGHGSGSGGREEVADRGLVGIAWFAFVLGFAHEEEFEIIALCTGSSYCLELMGAYALTVVAGILALTLLLVAGYKHFEERVERYAPYLPLFSAAVLVTMGVGFVLGLF